MPVPLNLIKGVKLSLLFAALLAFAGCAALPTPGPISSLQPLRIQADVTFEPLYDLMASCVPAGTAIYYTSSLEQADARLGWTGLRETAAYTYALSEQKVVLVVNPQNDLQSLTTEQIRHIYAGTLQNWQQTGQPDVMLNAWGYPPEDLTGAVFQEVFSLENLSLTKVQTAPDPKELRTAVAKDPGAIGFLPEWWVDKSVKVVSINAKDQARLSRPILAGTTVEPQGTLKAWLVCLQNGLKTN